MEVGPNRRMWYSWWCWIGLDATDHNTAAACHILYLCSLFHRTGYSWYYSCGRKGEVSFKYNAAKILTNSLIGKSLGSMISTYSLMGKYLGYSMYVLCAFAHQIPVQVLTFLSLIYSRGAAYFLGWRQQQVVLEYPRQQSYNKVQIYNLGEWWDLHGTTSMRWLSRKAGTHSIIIYN